MLPSTENIERNNNELQQYQVYCHCCVRVTSGYWDSDINEYFCSICDNNFVEDLNQGHEDFTLINNNNLNSNNNQQDNISNDTLNTNNLRVDDINNNNLLNLVMNSIINSENIDNNSITSLLNTNNRNHNIQPIGIIIRPMNQVRTNISSNNNTNSNNNESDHIIQQPQQNMSNSDIFNLLNNLTSFNAVTSNSNSTSSDLDARQLEQFLHHVLMNENSHAAIPPASKDIIDNLQRKLITSDTDILALGECSITQELFEVDDTMISLQCGHNYKQESIIQWLTMHNTCPVCRVPIS